MLGVLLIGAALTFSASTAINNPLTENISLYFMLFLLVAVFIFLPGYLSYRVIKDWGIKPKTQQEIYARRENEGIGLMMITNIILGFYMFFNLEKIYSNADHAKSIYDLEIMWDPVVIVVGFISYGFLLWACYNLAKSKGQSGWYAILSTLHLPGFIILLLFPNKFKK